MTEQKLFYYCYCVLWIFTLVIIQDYDSVGTGQGTHDGEIIILLPSLQL